MVQYYCHFCNPHLLVSQRVTDSCCFWLQFESIAGFGAIIDRLGEFTEVLEPFAERPTGAASSSNGAPSGPLVSSIDLQDVPPSTASTDPPLLALESVTLQSPDGSSTLVEDLTFQVLAFSCQIKLDVLVHSLPY